MELPIRRQQEIEDTGYLAPTDLNGRNGSPSASISSKEESSDHVYDEIPDIVVRAGPTAGIYSNEPQLAPEGGLDDRISYINAPRGHF